MAKIHDASVLDLQGGGRVGTDQSWVGACAIAHFAHASRRPCGGKQGHGESETFLLGSACGLPSARRECESLLPRAGDAPTPVVVGSSSRRELRRASWFVPCWFSRYLPVCHGDGFFCYLTISKLKFYI
jgi:hypothetical protein